jgi:hypothetical protein
VISEEGAAFLMTECSQELFSFTAHFSRRVEAGFTAGQVSTDGGALLLREADRKINLLKRIAQCFSDGRAPWRVSIPIMSTALDEFKNHEPLWIFSRRNHAVETDPKNRDVPRALPRCHHLTEVTVFPCSASSARSTAPSTALEWRYMQQA